MNPGELNTRVPFLTKADSNTLNLSDDAYQPYKTIWAKVKYVSSKETFSAMANNSLNVVNLIIRTRTDISNDMRFEVDNMQYDIKGIHPYDKRKMYLQITGELIKHER